MGYIGQTPSAVPLDGSDIADDIIDSQHYVDGSVDLAHMSSQSVDEDNIHISNAGTNGQFLSKQSGDAGGLTWADAGVTGLTNNSNTTWMTVSADEEVSMPLQPCFLAKPTSNVANGTGNGTAWKLTGETDSSNVAVAWTEVFDQGGNFLDGSGSGSGNLTGHFTAPLTGRYLLIASVRITSMAAATQDSMALSIVTSNFNFTLNNTGTNFTWGDQKTWSTSAIVDMDASDTAYLRITVSGATKIGDCSAGSVFSGCLIA